MLAPSIKSPLTTLSLGIRRLLAIMLLLSCLWWSQQFPILQMPLVAGLSVYFAVLLIFPSSWLIAVPLLLPVLDLTPWSGRIFFNVFDLLLLVTFASGLWHKESMLPGDSLSFVSKGLLAAFFLAHVYFTLHGFMPYTPPDTNALISYLSPYNSLRIAKGMFFGYLLIALLIQARHRGHAISQWFTYGMVSSIISAVAAIMWERSLFTDLFNFHTPYRVTGLFSSMHVGGAPVDAQLAMTLPFVITLFFFIRRFDMRLVALFITVLSLYGLFVTFSRANYPTGAIILFVMGTSLLYFLNDRLYLDQMIQYKSILAITAIAIIVITLGTRGFIGQRFSTIAEDLETRFVHWNKAINLMDSDILTQVTGQGKGTFPALYFWDQVANGQQTKTFRYQSEEGNNYLRIGKSINARETLDIRQRFPVSYSGDYRLQIKIRNTEDQHSRLLIEFCHRNLLLPNTECPWIGLNTTLGKGIWQTHNKHIFLKPSEKTNWLSGLPSEISILTRGLSQAIEIDEIQVFAPDGSPLIHNGAFDQSFDHWFYSYGNHLAWHIKNIWVDAYTEGGWTGLLLLLVLLLHVTLHLIKKIRQRDAVAPALLASMFAFVGVGQFDSTFDFPRMTTLFLLVTTIALMPSDTKVTLASIRKLAQASDRD